jgi:EAL domain-containing protein (putative c-di-GMP-specific phosphodiesterase class I)
VKIDQSFVAGIPVNIQDAALTSAIIAISHQLGLDVVAEGVEELSQLEFLEDSHCNFVQGNYFYMPLSPKDFAELF